MRKRHPFLFWSLMTILLLALIAVFFGKRMLRSTLPDVEKATILRVSVTADSAHVDIQLLLRNKGYWNFRVKSLHLKLYDDTVQLVSYANDSVRTLHRHEEKAERFFVVLPIKKIMERIRERQGQDSTVIDIRGEIVLNTFAGDITKDITQQVTVKIPTPPEVNLQQVEYLGKENGAHQLMVFLNFINRNERSLRMRDVHYQFTGSDMIAANGYLADLTIPARDSMVLRVPVQVKITDKLKLIGKIITGDHTLDYQVSVQGTIVSLTGIVKEDVPAVFTTAGTVHLRNNAQSIPIIFPKRKRHEK